ncbi:MAG: bZIP transcription factor [Actinomycetota bacterium]|nr:bZIP transcription factor [Actinomycetota bacterium]
MDAQGNGLTLEALAQRLEALERENTDLKHEVAELRGSGTRRGEVAALGGSETRLDGEPVPVLEGRVSRRSLLTKAGAAAVGTMAAGALMLRSTPEVKAHTATQIVQAHQVLTHTLRAETHAGINTSGVPVRGIQNSGIQAAVYGTNAGSWAGVEGGAGGTGPGVYGVNDGAGPGVRGRGAGTGPGVKGEGVIGVWGTSLTAGQAGVYAQTAQGIQGPGVVGDGLGPDYAGVLGRNQDGTGVWGQSSRTGYSGVHGEHTGSSGYGLVGDGKGSGSAGVLGRNPGGTGVRGESSTVGHAAVVGNHTNAGFEAIGVLGDTVDGVGVQGLGKNGVVGKSPRLGHAAVYGQHTGSSGYGIVGDGTGGSAGVLGRNSGGEGVRGEGSTSAEVAGVRGLGKRGVWGSSSATGYSGVYGEHTGTSGDGVVGVGKGVGAGVLGRNNTGYGGQFDGGRAQLMLKPGVITGKPTSGAHTKGEIYMDSAGALFVCVASNTSTAAAKWRKVTTTAV